MLKFLLSCYRKHKTPTINLVKIHRKKRIKTHIGSSSAGNIKRFLWGGIIEREEIMAGGPEGLIPDKVQKK